MPTYRRPFDKGALIIRFSVHFPSRITPELADVWLPPLPSISPILLTHTILLLFTGIGQDPATSSASPQTWHA